MLCFMQCNVFLEYIKEQNQQQEIIKGLFYTNVKQITVEFWKSPLQNTDKNPPNQKLMFTPIPSKPFEIIHEDTFYAQGQNFLNIIHSFSNQVRSSLHPKSP